MLIDDLEDGDSQLPTQDGRRGWWYTQDDGTSEDQIPMNPWGPTDADAFEGEFSARIAGSGFRGWGSTLGMTLNAECPYDASAFSGIEFWARGIGTTRVRFTTVATVPTDVDPGTCLEQCWDDFGTYIDLTDAWTQYTITWDQISQEGWGEPAEFDSGTLLAIVWQGGGALREFDIWLDDIQFTRDAESGS